MSSDGPIRGSFVVTEDDLLIAAREATGPASARWRIYVGFGLVVIVVVAGAGLWNGQTPSIAWMVWGGLIVGLGFWSRSQYDRRLRTYVSERLALGRSLDVAVTSTHLHIAMEPDQRSEYRLGSLLGAEVHDDGLLIAVEPRVYAFIPNRAFSSEIRPLFHRRVTEAAGLVPVSVSP